MLFFATFAGFAALRETAEILRGVYPERSERAQNDNVQGFFRSF
jgi:hypothetical protein